jgi:hypothetical protein
MQPNVDPRLNLATSCSREGEGERDILCPVGGRLADRAIRPNQTDKVCLALSGRQGPVGARQLLADRVLSALQLPIGILSAIQKPTDAIFAVIR